MVAAFGGGFARRAGKGERAFGRPRLPGKPPRLLAVGRVPCGRHRGRQAGIEAKPPHRSRAFGAVQYKCLAALRNFPRFAQDFE